MKVYRIRHKETGEFWDEIYVCDQVASDDFYYQTELNLMNKMNTKSSNTFLWRKMSMRR